MKTRSRPQVVALSAILSTVLTVPAHAAAPAPTNPAYGEGWRPLAPIAGGPRQEHTVAAVGNRVYVIGGIYPDPAGAVPTTNRVEVYDVRQDRWSEAAPLPVRINHPNVAAVGGRLYLLGGLSGGAAWRAVGESFMYDPRTDRWTRLPPMPDGTARGSAAVGVYGNKIYLAGGMRTLEPVAGGLQDTVDTVSSYDVVTGRWETLPNLPEARDHVAGAVVGTTFYVLGGRDRGQANVRDTVYALELSGDEAQGWAEQAPMPTPRGGLSFATVGTTIYTFGGEGNPAAGANGIFTQTEAYDTAADRWVRLPPMAVPRHGGAAAAVGDTIYLPGGGDALGAAPVAVNDAYRP